jgi:GT2 family glycosyltransferase
MQTVKLSVVILNYNTRDELAQCIESVQAGAGGVPVELIVIDNASTDGSAAMVRERFPGVRLIANRVNRYFAAGNNQGIEAAHGEYVWLLNPDVTLTGNALPALVRYMDAHPEAGALGCKMLFPGGAVQRNCARFSSYIDLLLTYTFVGALLRETRRQRERALWYGDWDRESARDVEVIPNSCVVIRRAALEQVGGLDESLKLYFTEEDWGRRAYVAGWALRYTPDAAVIHAESASVRKVGRRAQRLYFRDLLVFCDKYFGAPRTDLLSLALLPTWAAMRLRGTL